MQKHSFNLNIKPENFINAAIKIESEEKEKEMKKKIIKNWIKKLKSATKTKILKNMKDLNKNSRKMAKIK